jgi:hypothetical protein
MAVEKVQLGVTAIKELLDNGYTWLKKDDLGFGSIQEKYQASDVQINTIRKHPALKDLETTARIFVIIDDTKNNGATTTTARVSEPKHEESLESVSGPSTVSTVNEVSLSQDSNATSSPRVLETSDADSFSAFANL